MVTQTRELDIQAVIEGLVYDLACDDLTRCWKARARLVEIGKPAVSALVKALSSDDQWLRWKAAKALGDIGDPLAAEPLVRALEDEAVGVRWLAAEGLIYIGDAALMPLLEALLGNPNSVWLRQGAHHVIHDIEKSPGMADILKPLLDSLEEMTPSIDVTLEAWNALEQLVGGTGG